jgi:ParB-like chromosome segregation protein Spo0J
MGENEQAALKQRLINQDPKTMDPLIVRLMPDGDYELVDGEHRWRIAQELGWTELEVFVLEADDLTAKTRCVSSSLLRGHVNWFKLAEVVKQDQQNGINLNEAYKDILSDKALKELFSLDDLVPKARLDLEAAVKRFQTITLYDLHIISKFPAYLQEELAEEYKTHNIASHSLTQTLIKYIKQTQTTTPTTNNPYTHQEDEKQNNALLPKFDRPISPNDALRILNAKKQQQKTDTASETTQTKTSNKFDLDPYDRSEENTHLSDTESVDELAIQKSLLMSGGHYCPCGRLHRTNFKDRIYLKNIDITIQKENLIFEHVDFSPHSFLVYCNYCNTDQQVRVDNKSVEDEKIPIVCRNCQPARGGLLDVTTGDAVWFG